MIILGAESMVEMGPSPIYHGKYMYAYHQVEEPSGELFMMFQVPINILTHFHIWHEYLWFADINSTDRVT